MDYDTCGRIYEFFLGEFTMGEGQGGGEFYIPRSIVRLLEHLSEIISEKRAANESSGSTPVPGCTARRPRRAQASVGSKADGGGSTIILAEITVAKVTSLVAKDLSGVEAGQSHPGRVCSPDPGVDGLG